MVLERSSPGYHFTARDSPSVKDVLATLKACSIAKDLRKGKIIHKSLIESGLDSHNFVANTLVNMYCKCGSMPNARKVFDNMDHHDVIAWTVLVMGYADNGESQTALELFSHVTNKGCAPDAGMFVAVLKACKRLLIAENIMSVHSQAVFWGREMDTRVASMLVDLYAKCGHIQDARFFFDQMIDRDVTAWTALISGYVEAGQESTGLELFETMESTGCAPDNLAFVAAVKACARMAEKEEANVKLVKVNALCKGIALHFYALCRVSNMHVDNILLDMYAKCGSLEDMRIVFKRMPKRNVVSWTTMVFAYADHKKGDLALEAFNSMKKNGCNPNALTYVGLLRGCTNLAIKEESGLHSLKAKSLRKGKEIHREALKDGCICDIRVRRCLLDFYTKSGSMADAQMVFDKLEEQNVISWTVMISGYADSGDSRMALAFFSHMQSQGCHPDALAFVAALKACINLNHLEFGMAVHSQAVNGGSHTSNYVASTVIDMYAKCGSMADAQNVFDRMQQQNVVSWNALLMGYVDRGDAKAVLKCFWSMPCKPDATTFVAALKACTNMAANHEKTLEKTLESGIRIHLHAVNCCYATNAFVGCTLIDMYSKCKSIVDSHRVFEEMEEVDVVSWTALISGYSEGGQGKTALNLFSQMKRQGYTPNSFTYKAVLRSCIAEGAWEMGRALHLEIDAQGFQSNELAASLVDFYAKCGSMFEAQRVFDSLPKKNLTTWTALIAGYGGCGRNEHVIELFDRMVDQGLQPDRVTFLCLLSSCSHSGLVHRGKEYFDLMRSKYGINPDLEHYTCMVDMLGRANELDQALAFVKAMPITPSAVTWSTLLSACWKWKNVSVGRIAFDALVSLGDADAGSCALITNICNRWGMFGTGSQKLIKLGYDSCTA